MNYSRLRNSLGATTPGKSIEVDGINLTYNDEGEGLTIICLHAIGHGAADFQKLQTNLVHNYRVITIDFPSHGNSDDDYQPVSLQRYTNILTLFIDQLKLGKFVFIGNSIGGSVALQYTFLYPERVQGLILANPGGLDPMDRVKSIFTSFMANLFSQGLKKSWWYKKGLNDYYRYLVLPSDQAREQREKIIASGEEIALILTQAWQSFGNTASDLRYIAPSIKCPVLFTWASQDKIVQLGRCLPTIKQFPNMTLKLFSCGHSPHLETPKEFAIAVITFLEVFESHAATTTNS
ncbi:hypothetical protein AA650_16185 [Anabaena sp. WA102]|uniref:alpha/beta fold hydrolase n=1 Tax=Anabaena sp. WA102 TaxID=1647413 RepID=UPI0006AC09EA|nr:alpha/beta hydrolase [Anabaena sp. WA102]ALB41791.1 hypothetical protein AA650_16185 [Anabaena sp. WA102]